MLVSAFRAFEAGAKSLVFDHCVLVQRVTRLSAPGHKETIMTELILSDASHSTSAESHNLILDCQCSDPD